MNPDEGVKVLIVDDNPDKLQAHEAILADMNLNMIRAGSGREALRLVLQHDFAAILLDVLMPDMNGFETASIIRQRPRSAHTPILFITALAQSTEDVSTGYSLGAVDYVFAPVVPSILRAKVRVFVDLYEQREQVRRQAERMALLNQELELRVEEIERLNEELEGANKELEAFSYAVSHDLRAPVRRIAGFARVLTEDCAGQLDETGRRTVERIGTQTRLMSEMIEGLLDLARAARSEMRRSPVNLGSIAQEVVADLRQRDPARRVNLVVDDGAVVEGDTRLLRLVQENLVNNAWKFTSGRPEANIEFGTMQRAGETIYFVRDDGAGFDMSHAGKLFVPFQRLHEQGEYPGTGVGLATVLRIIHRHGGRIWAEGKPDKGATFFFTIGPAPRPCPPAATRG